MNRTVKHLIGTLLLIFCIGFFYLYSLIYFHFFNFATYTGEFIFIILYYVILASSTIYFLKNNLEKEFVIQCIFCLTLGNGLFFSFINIIIFFLLGDSEILYKVVSYIGYPLDIMLCSDLGMIFALISAYIPLIILLCKKKIFDKKRKSVEEKSETDS